MKYLFFIRYCTCNADGGLRQLKLNFTNKIAIKNLLILIFFEKKNRILGIGVDEAISSLSRLFRLVI